LAVVSLLKDAVKAKASGIRADDLIQPALLDAELASNVNETLTPKVKQLI
jgi:hypothetical protein